jgi:hypothetical protein
MTDVLVCAAELDEAVEARAAEFSDASTAMGSEKRPRIGPENDGLEVRSSPTILAEIP